MSFLENLFHGKSNKRLRQTIEAIRSHDFTSRFSTKRMWGEEKRLVEELNAVIDDFNKATARMESQYQYFGAILDTVNTLLMVVDTQGGVQWMNRAAIDGLCGFKFYKIDDLAYLDTMLPQQINGLRHGVQKLIHITNKEHTEKDYVATVANFYSHGLSYRLYALQNVQSIVQQSEIAAQQQLVHVLTHEIMNSLAPIISLSDTLCEEIGQGTLTENDTITALKAIHRRSDGLMQFVENYRKLQHIPAPQLADVVIGDLLDDIRQLFPEPYIHYDAEQPALHVNIDRIQIEQVIINILKNAQEAISSDSPSITIHTSTDKYKRNLIITIDDNGCGMTPEVIEHIFIPFYTTKTNGSGIGLSICKQIMSLHGGTITVNSTIGKGTAFTLTLPL